MSTSSRPFRLLSSALALLALAASLCAQTSIRPGGTARGTTRTGTGGTGTSTRTSTSSSSTSNGARQYRSNTMIGDAIIQVDPESRSLVVITDEETHEELNKIIKNLDRPKPQVLIKVVFVEVTYNKGYDVGLEASYIFNQSSAVPAVIAGTNSTVVAATNGTTTTTTTSNGGNAAVDAVAAGASRLARAGSDFGLSALTDGSFVRLLTDDWSATLRLLATRGKLEILSRPSIMARNNQEAVIVVGQEVPFITNSRITDDGQTINTIQYDNVGIILKVTPFITSEGTVEMIVAPEISSLTAQTVPISSTASAPVIAKRSAETVVVTPNGATVVIGGLMETQRTESIRKIPILGDIPLLGAAFRRTVKDDTKRELLIFLTPNIINNPAGLKTATRDEIARANLVRTGFKDDELTRYTEPGLFNVEPELPVDAAAPATVTKRVEETTTTVVPKPTPAPKAKAAAPARRTTVPKSPGR